MGAYLQQARIALEVYLERGRLALEELRNDRPEQAESLLMWRNAAFQNFRVAEALEKKAGQDVSNDPEIIRTMKGIEQLNPELEAALIRTRQGLLEAMARAGKNREKISKFHSGSREEGAFLNKV